MGLLHDLVYVVKVGNWRYTEKTNLDEAERLVRRLSGVVKGLHIEEERRERK